MRIAVVGLGKLGAPLAALLASHGHDVVGADASPNVVAQLNAGRTPVDEPGLAPLVHEHRERLTATTDTAAAVAEADMSFVVVPTPSAADGTFSNRFVVDAVTAIGRGLRGGSRYHVVVITSTVMPLSTEREIKPALEAASGRRVGGDVGLCYNPEFIALGSVLYDMTHPDLVLIGESDTRAGRLLEDIHRTFIPANAEVRRMAWVNAEIAKIAVNTFVTTKISYANMLAELCERLPGGDVDVVTMAIGVDKRIGHKYLRGAVGYGGPCFPRDNAALAAAARHAGAHADIAAATDAINSRQVERVATIVKAHATPGRERIRILGLSYKPDTPVVEESQGVQLANMLIEEGFAVTAFDPAAMDGANALLASPVGRAGSLAQCVEASEVLVLMVAWPAFGTLPELLRNRPRPGLVLIDCWRQIDPATLQGLAAVVYPGTAGAIRPPSGRTARDGAGRQAG